MSGQLSAVMFDALARSGVPFELKGHVENGGYWFTMEAGGQLVSSGDYSKVELEMFKRLFRLSEPGADKP